MLGDGVITLYREVHKTFVQITAASNQLECNAPVPDAGTGSAINSSLCQSCYKCITA